MSYFLIKLAYKNSNGAQTITSKFFIIIAMLIPILVASLRYGVGTDYFNYNYIFNYERSHGWNYSSYPSTVRLEIGFWFLVKLLTLVSKSNVWVWACIYGLFFIFSSKAISYYANNKDYCVELAYFILLTYFFSSGLNISRQILALSIVLYASTLIFENKKSFFFWIGIATFFHYSAIITVVLWFLWDHKKNKPLSIKTIAILDGALFLVFLSYKKIYQLLCLIPQLAFLQRYEYTLFHNSGKNRTFIIILFFTIVFIILWSRLENRNPQNALFLQLVLLDLIFGYGALSNKVLYRLALYYEIFYLVLMPQIPALFNKNSRVIVKVCVLSYWILYFVAFYGVVGNAGIVPYRMIGR